MSKSKFLEFVTKNLPPCLPGDKIYWFDCETGQIRLDRNPVKAIALDKNWEWKIVDDDGAAECEFITPNENEYFCLTPEDAKKFRDKVKYVEYTVLENEDSSVVIKKDVFTAIATLGIDEKYLDGILKADSDIKAGMAVKLFDSVYTVCRNQND